MKTATKVLGGSAIGVPVSIVGALLWNDGKLPDDFVCNSIATRLDNSGRYSVMIKHVKTAHVLHGLSFLEYVLNESWAKPELDLYTCTEAGERPTVKFDNCQFEVQLDPGEKFRVLVTHTDGGRALCEF